jgi:hypothetical protein
MLQETIATAPSLIGAPLVMAGRGAAAAAPTLARAAYGGAVQGGALGSLTGAGASEADNPTGVVADAGRGALVGAATGAAAPYVIAGAGKLAGAGADLAKRGADALRSKANVNRLAASGTYGAQLRNIMQNKGEDAVQELGEEIERLGIHKGKPLLGVIPNPWPQPPKTYADNSERVLADAGRRMGAAEGAIAQAGDPPIDVGSIDAGLRAGADDVATGFDPSSKGEAGFMRDFADRIDAAGKPGVEIGPSTGKVPFSQALKERRRIDANIDWTRKGGYEGAGMQEQVRRGVAGDLRAATREGLDEAVARGELDPKTVEAWKQANKDYATAATVHDPAVARVYQEYGNQKIGLPGWLAATSGAASGGPLGAVGGALVGQLAKSRGTPLLAGTQRAGQRLLSGASNALSAAGTLAPTVQPEIGGVAAARAAERAVENKFPAGFASPAHAQSPGDAQLDRSADLALQDPTEPHAQALAQKQGDDRRTAYSVLIHTDPEFRARQKQRAKQQQEQQERTQEQ